MSNLTGNIEIKEESLSKTIIEANENDGDIISQSFEFLEGDENSPYVVMSSAY